MDCRFDSTIHFFIDDFSQLSSLANETINYPLCG